MALLARRDLALAPGMPPPVGSPARLGRLLWHRVTGR
jgi:phytoene synthase